MKKLSFLLLCLGFTASCSYSGAANFRPYVSWTGLVALQKTERNSQWAIDSNATVYLASPMGLQDDQLMQEMNEVFLRYYPRTRQGQFRESLEQAFVSARYSGMDYVVYPRITRLADQKGIGPVVREEIAITEFQLGKADFEILIFASQGEELVDQLKLNTRGSVFTSESRALIWPPLDEYLRAISQFSLAQRY